MAGLLNISKSIIFISIILLLLNIVAAEVSASSTQIPALSEQYDDYYSANTAYDDEEAQQRSNTDFEIYNKVIFDNTSTSSTLRLDKFKRVIKTNMNTIILNGTELLFLEVALGKSNVSQRSIGQLDNIDEDIVDIEAITWNKHTLFVVALVSRYNVYWARSDSDNGLMVPIEHIALHGEHQKIVLFSHGGELFGLIGNVVHSGESSSTIRLYKWRQSHFTLLATQNLNTFSNIMYCTNGNNLIVLVVKNDFTDMETLTGSKKKRLTLVLVHTFENERLRRRQSMFVYATSTHFVSVQQQCMLLSVSEQTSEVGKVETFVWDYDYLKKYQEHEALWIDQVTGDGQEMIVVQGQNRLVAYTQPPLDKAYPIKMSGFKTNESAIVLMKSNGRQFLLALQEKNEDDQTDLEVNCMELRLESAIVSDDVGSETFVPDKCYLDLQSAIQTRQSHVDRLNSEIDGILRKDQTTQFAGTIKTTADVIAYHGNFSRLNINTKIKITAIELLKQVDRLKQRLNEVKSLLGRRPKRDATNNATEFEIINVKYLNVSSDLFKNVLLKSKDIHFDKEIRTRKLTVQQIRMPSNYSNQTPVLRSGKPTNVLNQQAKSIPKVRNLIVKTINGIDWDEFYHSTYQMGSNVAIKGNIVLVKPSHIREAELKHINNIPVDTFFTLTTPQTITANMNISRFFAMNVNSRLVNEIQFGNDVAISTDNTTIQGPVKLERCTIDKLTLSENENDFARHIVGTEQEDLSQIYNGKVTIKGSLKLNHITLERPNRTKIFVNEKRFYLNVADHYWMKSIDQHFDTVRFEKPIVAPQIHTKRINDKLTSNCLLINQNPPYNVSMIVEQAYVRGDVRTDPQYATSASLINEECIRRTDTAIVTGGCKTFTGHLSIEDFQCKNIDEIDINQFIQRQPKGKSYDFDCVKQFKRITVEGKVKILSDLIEIGYFNGNDLVEFEKNYVRINNPVSLDAITFAGNVNVQRASIGNIAGKAFNEVVQEIEGAVGEDGIIKTVHVLGDVVFADEIYADTVNGVHFDEYLSMMVTKNSEGLEIFGTKQFKSLIVKQLSVRKIGSIDLEYWFENALHMSKPQIIPVPWTIECIQTEQLDTVSINGVPLNLLLDSSADLIEISSDIIIDSIIVGNSIRGQLSCDLAAIEKGLAEGFLNKHWPFVEIVENVQWPYEDYSTPINKLIRYAVTDADQEIFGDVKFINPIVVQVARTKNQISKTDIMVLRQDALIKNAEFQQVIATKRFCNNISIANLITENFLSVPIINSVDILRLNESMFRIDRDNHVTGVKTFLTTPSIYHLYVRGTINGIESVDIVCSNSTNLLPPISFYNTIYIEGDLTISDILNGLPLDYVLANRVRLNGPPQELTGLITFKNLVIKGRAAQLPQINGIPIEDVVVLSSDALQTITGHKNIYGNVTIDGPAMFSNINGIDVVQTYMNTIFLDQNMKMEGLEVCGNVILQRGIYVKDRLNDVEIKSLTHWNPPSARDLAPINEEVSSTLVSAHSALQQSDLKTKNFLYLDYAADIRIKYEFNPSIPKTFTVDTIVACERCSCPAQNDVSITSTLQIFIHRRPAFERQIKINGQHLNVTILTSFRASECGSTNSTRGTKIMWRKADTEISEQSMTLSETSIAGARLFEQDHTSLMLINYYNGSIAVMNLDEKRWNFIGVVGANGQRHHHMEVLSWKNYNILLVFALPAERDVHGKAEMYYFDGAQFQILHGQIPGDYDRFAVSYMQTRNEYMVWLTHSGTDVLTIFKAVYQAQLLQRFALLQKIVVDGMVENIVPMNVDDFKYMVVVTQNDHLYLYKYNYLEGWIASTHGYFKGVETVVPFQLAGRDYLFVSMKSASTALVVYHQGIL